MGRMKQLWALTAVAIVAVIAAGWFVGVRPQRAKVETLNASTQSQLTANGSLAQEIDRLSDLKSGVGKQQKRLRAIAANIPDNPALPSLIRSLSKIEDASNVMVVSITPAIPALETPPVSAAPPTRKSVDSEDNPESATKASPPPAQKVAPKAPPTTAGQLASIPLIINVSGEFADVQLFVAGLEKLQRSLVVGSLSILRSDNEAKPGDAATVQKGSLNVTLQARVFMRVPAAPAVSVPAAAPVEK